jgi:hypothetical protein
MVQLFLPWSNMKVKGLQTSNRVQYRYDDKQSKKEGLFSSLITILVLVIIILVLVNYHFSIGNYQMESGIYHSTMHRGSGNSQKYRKIRLV